MADEVPMSLKYVFRKIKILLSNVVPLFAFIFSQALDWNHACFKQRSKKGNKMTDMRSIVLSQWAKSIELGCTAGYCYEFEEQNVEIFYLAGDSERRRRQN